MQRSCDSCGVTYEAKRQASRYCSARCRQRAKRSPRPAETAVEAIAATGIFTLERTTERELKAAGRLDTILGRQALALAQRICSPAETGSAIASLSKEFRAVMDVAMQGVHVAADPLDELRARRDHKRATG